MSKKDINIKVLEKRSYIAPGGNLLTGMLDKVTPEKWNIKGEAGLGARGMGFLTGKEPVSKIKTSNFNIPIIDINALKKSFGLDNPNTKESFELIFGKEQYDKIQNVLALGEQIQQTRHVG